MATVRWGRPLYRLRRVAEHLLANTASVRNGTQPGSIFFAAPLCRQLSRDERWLAETAEEYRRTPAAWRMLSRLPSPNTDSGPYALSLDVAEGFAAWALVKHLRPRVVVELGTQLGVSARLWKEALTRYVPDHELILVDVEDQRKFIADREARFIKGDGLTVFRDIVARTHVDLLFNDAHPYELISGTVSAAMERGVQALVFHDVGRGTLGTFRPESAAVPRHERLIDDGPHYRRHGTWERHVMAEAFGEDLLHADQIDHADYRVQIYDSRHGFGVALRRDD